ncbi:hypothetical protein PUNSTDRAFT_146447 [Punctularia strigosozonata HHB-11173 SS5]|uniref:Uncharacterized protein n=1 Tax=Punctularia strigosozonata (strain HHB-11173) TaxID=741275 RepID=R7S565_PUNST|nr:uncharacterized protein PUNSTDRAFT_146447 [Punctularia strigosozonata HHB-11173 SS5]EIN04476.1 hypothetical protein PUNSTDRAFT_146447 [Punctularia strigosozonata HHB-11173 SS5]
MSLQKDKYYWAQLRAALTAGSWGATFPAKSPRGEALSWSELLRKFKKHCRGYDGYEEVFEVASQTQALALLVAAGTDLSEDGLDGDAEGLYLGDECVLAEERREEARTSYDVLKNLNGTKSDSVKVLLAYYAYALSRPSECLQYLSEASTLANGDMHLPQSSSSATNVGTQRSTITASTLAVPGQPSSTRSETPSSSRTTTSWVSHPDPTSQVSPYIADGRSWIQVEVIRSICLEGMSNEKLTQGTSPSTTALQSYMKALPIISSTVNDLPRPYPAPSVASVPSGPGKLDFASFIKYRELWRWTERLLWRAIVLVSLLLSQPTADDTSEQDRLWTLLQQYQQCASHWPPTFRPLHRSTIYTLHIRALILAAPSTSLNAPFNSVPTPKTPAWLPRARSVIQEYRAVLDVSTTFPKAGEKNTKVEELVDLSVAVWEASGGVGEYAGWVIDILWWATRLTFNSHRIYRHMSRLLYAAGDVDLARRFLGLYAQVVSKARETIAAEEQQKNEDIAHGVHEIGVQGVEARDPHDKSPKVEMDLDGDNDEDWVRTLVAGARMLCRLAEEKGRGRLVGGGAGVGGDGRQEVREAARYIAKARETLNAKEDESELWKELRASVDLAEGVCEAVSANKENDPGVRGDRLARSRALLESSVLTHPTATAHHHLALALSRPAPSLDFARAIEHARVAVEEDPGEIRHWHLLGLLLTATGDWRGAKGVLEVGSGIGEPDTDDANGEEIVTNGDTSTIVAHDFSGAGVLYPNGSSNGEVTPTAPTPTATTVPGPESLPPAPGHRLSLLLDYKSFSVPPASSLLPPRPDRPRPSRQQCFEYALQLRMTQLALSEHVEGPEGAEPKSVEVFAWVAEHNTGGTSSNAGSEAGGRRAPGGESRDGHGGSQQSYSNSPALGPRRSVDMDQINHTTPLSLSPAAQPVPIPITVSPASPDSHTDVFPFNLREQSSLSSVTESVSDKTVDGGGGVGSRGKKVQRMLKQRVNKGQERITTISRKIGSGVVRNGSVRLRRTLSAPNFTEQNGHRFQASSIHSRRYFAPSILQQDPSHTDLPLPHNPSPIPPLQTATKPNDRGARNRRLLSDLWLMSAATFRRLSKIEQARGAIQEAEVQDENNPAVWVQLGLYYIALGSERRAKEAFGKALFISPDDVSAIVHLCRLYLTSAERSSSLSSKPPAADDVDLAAGMLSELTRGPGWDIAEAWYFLAKAYGMQGRKDRERECLAYALGLSEHRAVRDMGTAVGWCL